MLVIRRMVDRRRAYTAIFLRGEPPKIFPTTDQEHARILAIFKQDRAYEGICNDFSDYELADAEARARHAPSTQPAAGGLAACSEDLRPELAKRTATERSSLRS